MMNKSPLAFCVLALTALVSCHQQSGQMPETARGQLALQHVEYLSEQIGPRIQGTPAEAQARAYITEQFYEMGYKPVEQPFTITRTNKAGDTQQALSSNVMAVLPGQSDKEIIVVAHLDSVRKGRGADDNASGIGVLLEAAEALRGQKLPYTVRFLAVGAEESYSDGVTDGFRNGGTQGSRYYASQMTAGAIAKTQFVINMDSLIAGDHMNIYGSEGADGFVREAALALAKQRGYDIQTSPGFVGETPEDSFPAGSTGDWSDHAAFKHLGIPYAYFEATNWTVGDLDGYTQTEKHGAIWHTDKDNLDFLHQEFPGRTELHLRAFSDVLINLLKQPPTR